ncbi:hypothetical protein J6590_080521 [Homalodisca vitripennis]|nr:hypothetical protein J6590_080521 [Homalodisca vitripennis]
MGKERSVSKTSKYRSCSKMQGEMQEATLRKRAFNFTFHRRHKMRVAFTAAVIDKVGMVTCILVT